MFRSVEHHYGDMSYIQYDVLQLLLHIRYISLVIIGRARHVGFLKWQLTCRNYVRFDGIK